MKQEHAVTRGVGQEQTHRVGDTAVLADLGEGSPFRAIVELTALRNVLRLNAVFSIVTGVAMALFAERLGARLGIVDDWIAPLRAIGVGLIGCAVGLLVIGAMAAHRVVTATVPVVVCDLGWVIGTIVLIATGSFSTRGAVIGGLVAAVVLDFAILQWRALRRSLAPIERAPAERPREASIALPREAVTEDAVADVPDDRAPIVASAPTRTGRFGRHAHGRSGPVSSRPPRICRGAVAGDDGP